MGQTNSKKVSKFKKNDVTTAPGYFGTELLLYGYIRIIEKDMDRKVVIIPEMMILLCLKFYEINKLMYLIERNYDRTPTQLYITSVCDERNWICKFHNFSGKAFTYRPQHDTSIHLQRNITLPSQITSKYANYIKYPKHANDLIFMTYNYENHCFLVDPLECVGNKPEINAYHWELPNTQHVSGCNTFSQKYGFITFNRTNNHINGYNLSLNDYKYDELQWKWSNLASKLYVGLLRTPLEITLIENEKLILFLPNLNMELLDLDTKKFTLLSNSKTEFSHGITGMYSPFYDAASSLLYVIAQYRTGKYASQYKEIMCYDFVKTKWYQLLSPVFDNNDLYGKDTILWKQYNYLYAAGLSTNAVQYIDLRSNKATLIDYNKNKKIKKWKNKKSHWMQIWNSFDSLTKYGVTPRYIIKE